jgi:hypothetical protein
MTYPNVSLSLRGEYHLVTFHVCAMVDLHYFSLLDSRLIIQEEDPEPDINSEIEG